jgi:hypothetical protein
MIVTDCPSSKFSGLDERHYLSPVSSSGFGQTQEIDAKGPQWVYKALIFPAPYWRTEASEAPRAYGVNSDEYEA